MHILKKVANGMKMEDVLKNNEDLIQLIMAFVDDNSIFTNDKDDDIQNLKEKYNKIENCGQDYEKVQGENWN
jgi:hypothetical protein